VAAGLPSWEEGSGRLQRQWSQAHLHGRKAVVGSSASGRRLTFMGGGGREQRQWPQAYLHGRGAVVGSSASDCSLTFMGGRRW